MPIFEFQCETDGVFEALLNRIPGDGHHPCPVCDVPAPCIPSLYNPRPDTLWAGHVVPGQGYVTSESRLNKSMKEKKQVRMGDATDFQGMRKMADEAAAARDAEFAKDSRAFMRQKAAERGLLDAEGNLKPEASKPLSDTPLIHTNDDRVRS